jgi:hypothetical protein
LAVTVTQAPGKGSAIDHRRHISEYGSFGVVSKGSFSFGQQLLPKFGTESNVIVISSAVARIGEIFDPGLCVDQQISEVLVLYEYLMIYVPEVDKSTFLLFTYNSHGASSLRNYSGGWNAN